MKTKLPLFCLCSLLAFLIPPDAGAQGLIGIGRETGDEDFGNELPLTFTVGGGVGWDSNSNTSSVNPNESAYINGGIGAVYGAGNKTTQVNLGAYFSTIYYFDNAPGLDDTFYNARFTLDAVHRVNPRLTLSDTAYFAYEIEPDYEIGASTARRSDQYIYYFNRLAATYAWSRRVSTVTFWEISGIQYDSSPVAITEDRLTNTLGNQFRYALSRQTTLTGSYRYSKTNFDSIPRDSNSHFLLAGVDHYFSRTTAGVISGGAQFYNDELTGSETKPYVEAALTTQLTEDTSLRWANRLGFEENEISGFQNRYGYRTGISAVHKITPYLTGNLGVSYSHSKFSGAPLLGTTDADEDAIYVNLGIVFQIRQNTDISLNYWYTNYSSDIPFRDYDRNRVALGITTTF